MKKIIGIACVSSNRAIGSGNKLVYNLKVDMNHFKNTTMGKESEKQNAVIMGRKTFDSIGRALPGRLNCILSKSIRSNLLKNVKFFTNIDDCIISLKLDKDVGDIYIIGGESLYKYFMDNNLYDELYLSFIDSPKYDGGTSFFPLVNFKTYSNLTRISNETIIKNSIVYNYSIFHLIKSSNNLYLNMNENNLFIQAMSDNNQEYQYLHLINKVLTEGTLRETRNAKTISLFSEKMDFDISKSFPLLTTKKVYFKAVVKELLWFLRGNTNSKELEKDKVNIWKGNSSRDFLDSIGLEGNEEGDCGPIYGFQWRHFNAKYINSETDYTGQGIDQLQNVIDLIKNNPTSRRIYMTAWNPCQLSEMALPPCHVSYQFYVRNIDNKSYLDCMMYQRSGDLFLGVPFNVASTSLLVYILANICNISPGKISIVIGDAHIYENHIEQVKTQLSRVPSSFPTLSINKQLSSVEDINYEDIILDNYNPQATIKASMIA